METTPCVLIISWRLDLPRLKHYYKNLTDNVKLNEKSLRAWYISTLILYFLFRNSRKNLENILWWLLASSGKSSAPTFAISFNFWWSSVSTRSSTTNIWWTTSSHFSRSCQILRSAFSQALIARGNITKKCYNRFTFYVLILNLAFPFPSHSGIWVNMPRF